MIYIYQVDTSEIPGVGHFVINTLIAVQFRDRLNNKRRKLPMNKRSIGKLRPATRSKEKSPNLIGKLALQRITLNEIVTQMREDGGSEITCNIAGWFNVDPSGKYITVEISEPVSEICTGR